MGSPRKDDVEAANRPENKIKQKGMKMEGRSCTDVLSLIIFSIWVTGIFAASGYAFKTGNPANIITPFDSDGNQCGMPDQGNTTDPEDSTVGWVRDFTEYKYKAFTDLTAVTSGSNDMYNAVCVKKCPESVGDVLECRQNSLDYESCPRAQFGTDLARTYCLPKYEEAKETFEMLY